MGRPRKSHRRNRQLNLALSEHELETIRARASHAGRRPVEYARALLLGDNRAATIVLEALGAPSERLLHEQLKRLGNNLNQIARMQNTLRAPAPPSLEPLLAEIRRLIARSLARDH